MGAQGWVSAQRLHGRSEYPDCDRLCATAHRSLCDSGPAGDVAGGPAVGTWRLCGVYCGTWTRPAARIAGHAGGRTGGAADLVDSHGCRNSRWALLTGLPFRSMGCGTWPRSHRATASDRRAPCAESHGEVPAALSHRFIVVVTLTSLLFWALLGVCTSIAFGRVSRP